MSLFPAGYDPRDPVVAWLDLVEIDTPDGPQGFLLGVDGVFTSTDARVWWGCTMAQASDLDLSPGGAAPMMTLSLSFIADPDADELVTGIRSLGLDYVKDREVSFYLQPLLSINEFWAPTKAPVLIATRRAASIVTVLDGPMQRRIELGVEGAYLGRNSARGYRYTTADHANLTGSTNPSLTYMPADNRQEEKLFG